MPEHDPYYRRFMAYVHTQAGARLRCKLISSGQEASYNWVADQSAFLDATHDAWWKAITFRGIPTEADHQYMFPKKAPQFCVAEGDERAGCIAAGYCRRERSCDD